MTTSLREIDRGFPGIGGLVRASIIVFGAMVALQSSQDFDVVKVAYLGAAALALVGSVWTVCQRRGDPLVGFAAPWLAASLLIAGLVALSLPVAMSHGTAFPTWLRDAAAYALVVAGPWVAIDLAWSTTRRGALKMIVIAGGLATVSYAVVWVQRRGITDLAVDRLVLPSFMLATTLFAVTVALAVSAQRGRYRWAAVASVTIALLLLAGTRTTLAILIAPIAILAVAWQNPSGDLRSRRLVPALLPMLTAGIIVASTQLTWAIDLGQLGGSGTNVGGSGGATGSSSPTQDPHSLGGRYDTFGSVISGRDASMQDRIAQTRAAWDLFLTSPIVGSGLGAAVPWTTTTGHLDTEFTADTPVLVLAKFGALGLVLVGVLGAAWVITIRRLKPGGRITQTSRLALVGLGAAILLLTPFGWQLEDKGTGLAIILVLGLAFTEARDAGLRGPGQGDEA